MLAGLRDFNNDNRTANAPWDALTIPMVCRFMPGETPGVFRADIQAPCEIESAGHQRSPLFLFLFPATRDEIDQAETGKHHGVGLRLRHGGYIAQTHNLTK